MNKYPPPPLLTFWLRPWREFSISVRNKYSSASDEELDNIILDIKRNFPNTGYKRMNGFLSQRGYTVQQHRVIESMRRVDPEGVLLRRLEMGVINRRHYHVAGLQCLWHIDENHKLIQLVLYQLFLTKRSQLGVLKCKWGLVVLLARGGKSFKPWDYLVPENFCFPENF